MILSPAQKITFKTEIANRLSPKTWSQIDLILKEFGAFVSDEWQGNEFDYVISMLHGVDDVILQNIAEYLHIETGENSVLDVPEFWNEGDLCVFISHLAKYKLYASDIQKYFGHYGISGFVAHEDIIPDSEWQGEIEKALQTCDALVALLHDGFRDSDWTEQEVGYALGRGIPVFSVRIDIDPYGLFGKKQAFNGKDKNTVKIVQELADAYIVHPKTQQKYADVLIRNFCMSNSYAESKRKIELIEKISVWKTEYSQKLYEANKNNSQISGSWGVTSKINSIIEKMNPEFVPEK